MKAALIPGGGGRFKVWDEPKRNARYTVGVDVAEGKVRDRTRSTRAHLYSYSDQRPDYSAVHVSEVETGQHVASWHGYIQPTEFYPVVAAIGLYYNTALVVPEINSMGIAVVEGLTMVIKYPNVYRSKVFNKVESDFLGTDWGWRTTVQTRPLLIARIDEALNGQTLFTRDKDLIRELRTMQIDETGVPRAKGKDKDDRVIACGLSLQGRFELLYGTLTGGAAPGATLSPLDSQVWDHIHKQQEASDRGRRRAGSSHGRGRGLFGHRRLHAGPRS